MVDCAATGRTVKACLHGLAVEIACAVPALDEQVARVCRPFQESSLPDEFTPTSGSIQPYDEQQVLRSISPHAQRIAFPEVLVELYQDNERFWMIDERVGLIEINFLKSQWRAWVLQQPGFDPVRLVEVAVLWPLAQLLRSKGLFLLPAASVVRAGWSVLLIAPFSLEPELRAMVRAGYRVIGQRWSAVREDAGRLELLHMPGEVERFYAPHLREAGRTDRPQWVDLTAEHIGCTQNHAPLNAVLIAAPGRRNKAHLSELAPPRAVEVLRAGWPLVELHPTRRVSLLPMKLAQHARCGDVQFSRSPNDLLVLLDSLKYSRGVQFNPASRVTPTVAVLRPGASPVESPAARTPAAA